VFGGMVLASFVGVLFVPALFAFFEIATERVSRLFRPSVPPAVGETPG